MGYMAIGQPIRADIDIGLATLLKGRTAGTYGLAVALQAMGSSPTGPIPLDPVPLRLSDVEWVP